MSTRDDFANATRRKLAERTGFICSNPDCQAFTMGPAKDDAMTLSVGIAAHITAAAPGGPRYDPNLTALQRKASSNGIWLCQICAKTVDSDKSNHTVQQLQGWKRRAEKEARIRLGVSKANSHFRLLPEDQTLYINVRRFHELALKSHIHINAVEANAPLLDREGSLAAYVLQHERALKALLPEALSLRLLEDRSDLEKSVGHLISFEGDFRSKNAPRLKNGDIPRRQVTGDITKDHVIYARYTSYRLVLPLDAMWYASWSAVGFFRSPTPVPIRGLARVHSWAPNTMIASPVWLALPASPIAAQIFR